MMGLPSNRARRPGRPLLFRMALLLPFLILPATSYGSGLLIADGGFGGMLRIEEQHVDVTINNGIAVTTVTQVFRNLERRQVEALYTFPVPKGASVSNFSMWINGKEMIGEVVEKEKAREIYESYKAKRVDPGLLEQVDYKTFEMRIFPIGPEATQRVQITYYQDLAPDHDQVTWVYPLATNTRHDAGSQTSGTFSLNLRAKSEIPIASLDCPSHPDAFVVANHSPNLVQASMEADGVDLDRDFVLSYQLQRPKTGVDLITSAEEGDDGYFMLTLATGDDLEKYDEGMDYLFVLDVSGSMKADGKMGLSRSSIEAFLNELGPEDRFELMAFNIQPTPLFRGLEPVTDDLRAVAGTFLDSREARGGTELLPAMELAFQYGDPDRTLNILVLSDGMTEQSNRATLLQQISQRPDHTRVFCIGVGNEVDRGLLEQVAEDAGGLAAFLSQGDDFSRQAKAFRRKLIRPAVTNLRLEFDGVEVYDLEPRTLPNLFHGAPLQVFGRYRNSGEAKVTCFGEVDTVGVKLTADLEFPAVNPDNPSIERMWAWNRIDRILKVADRFDTRDTVKDEVVRLGEAFSIVTEYTSFLVLENDAEYQRWNLERRNLRRTQRDREAQRLLADNLNEMRSRSVADLGPTENSEVAPKEIQQDRPRPADVGAPVSQPVRSSPSGGGGGSGPIGPLFLAILAVSRKLRGKKKEA